MVIVESNRMRTPTALALGTVFKDAWVSRDLGRLGHDACPGLLPTDDERTEAGHGVQEQAGGAGGLRGEAARPGRPHQVRPGQRRGRRHRSHRVVRV